MNVQDQIIFDLLPKWERHIGRTMKRALPEGISPPIEFALVSIRKPMTMTELARVMQISKQQSTKIADRLIELGLAQRQPDEHDRRIVRLAITDKGREHIETTRQETVLGLQALFTEMGDRNRARFFEALGMIKQVFDDLDSRSTDRE